MQQENNLPGLEKRKSKESRNWLTEVTLHKPVAQDNFEKIFVEEDYKWKDMYLLVFHAS